MPQLKEEYIRKGKIRYVFRDLPLEQIHPHAFKAAEAANCAAEQGKFWEMHDRMFENMKTLAPNQLIMHAQAIGLEATKFSQCLESGKFASEVRNDMADANAANIPGTPGFVVGIVNTKNPNDRNVRIFRTFTGAQPYSVFKATLDAALVEADKQD